MMKLRRFTCYGINEIFLTDKIMNKLYMNNIKCLNEPYSQLTQTFDFDAASFF